MFWIGNENESALNLFKACSKSKYRFNHNLQDNRFIYDIDLDASIKLRHWIDKGCTICLPFKIGYYNIYKLAQYLHIKLNKIELDDELLNQNITIHSRINHRTINKIIFYFKTLYEKKKELEKLKYECLAS